MVSVEIIDKYEKFTLPSVCVLGNRYLLNSKCMLFALYEIMLLHIALLHDGFCAS